MANTPKALSPMPAGNEYGNAIWRHIHAWGLINDPQTMRPIAGAFEDWELMPENAGTDDPAVTATLREGLEFSDGEPLTAEDVKFTQDYMQENSVPGDFLPPEYNQERVVDDPQGRTVSWFTSRPASDLLQATVGLPIVAKHVWENVDNPVQYAPRENDGPVGAGPFELRDTSWGEWVELDLRTDYVWQNGLQEVYPWLNEEGPFVDGIRFQIFQGLEQLFQALKNGDIDQPYAENTLDQAVEASEMDGLDVVQSGSPGWYMRAYNTRRVPFDDVAFRQFLGKAVNQRWVIENLHQGLDADYGSYLVARDWDIWRPPEPEELITTEDPYEAGTYANDEIDVDEFRGPATIPDLSFPKDTNQIDYGQEVVDALREFLINHPEAKHDYSLGPAESEGVDSIDGQEIYVNGEPLAQAHTDRDGNPGQGPIELTDYPPEQGPLGYEQNTVFHDGLLNIGLPMTRTSVPWGSLQPKAYVEENFDMYVQPWPDNPWVSAHLRWMLSSSQADLPDAAFGDSPYEPNDGSITQWNSTGYQGADDIIFAQDQIVDPEERSPYVKQLLTYIYHDHPQTCLYYPINLQAVTTAWTDRVVENGGIGVGVANTHSYLNMRQNPDA